MYRYMYEYWITIMLTNMGGSYPVLQSYLSCFPKLNPSITQGPVPYHRLREFNSPSLQRKQLRSWRISAVPRTNVILRARRRGHLLGWRNEVEEVDARHDSEDHRLETLETLARNCKVQHDSQVTNTSKLHSRVHVHCTHTGAGCERQERSGQCQARATVDPVSSRPWP